MKRIFYIICLLLLFSCGSDAGQVGVGGNNNIAVHGHSGADDGGILKTTETCVYMSTNQTISANTTTIMNIDSETYDSLNLHTLGTNSVSAKDGYNYAKISCNIYTTSTATNPGGLSVSVLKNGSPLTLAAGLYMYPQSGKNANNSFISYVIPITKTDYFQIQLRNYDLSVAATAIGGACYCSINLYL